MVFISNGFCQVSVAARTNKTAYLVGEPVFVVLDVKNIGNEAIGYSYCDSRIELAVDKAEKKQHPNLWGCSLVGMGIDGGCGLDHPPLMGPNETVSFQYLLKDYRFTAGNYVLHVKGKAGVRWKYYPDIRPNSPPSPPPQHKDDDPVQGASIDISLPLVMTSGTPEELQRAYASYIHDAEGLGTGMEEMRQAREAISEMAPEFLEKTIAGFAASPISTPDLAVSGLGHIDTPESRADLIKLYDNSTDLNLRSQIVAALAEIGTTEEVPFLATLLLGRSTKRDDEIRQWAARSLGRIGGDDAVNALGGGLSSPNPYLRSTIAEALGNTRSRAAVPLLIHMYSDKDGSTQNNEVCGALEELTHRQWCNGSVIDVGVQQSRWLRWWKANGVRVPLYGSDQCPNRTMQLPVVP